jgi:hypothetical protein
MWDNRFWLRVSEDTYTRARFKGTSEACALELTRDGARYRRTDERLDDAPVYRLMNQSAGATEGRE